MDKYYPIMIAGKKVYGFFLKNVNECDTKYDIINAFKYAGWGRINQDHIFIRNYRNETNDYYPTTIFFVDNYNEDIVDMEYKYTKDTNRYIKVDKWYLTAHTTDRHPAMINNLKRSIIDWRLDAISAKASSVCDGVKKSANSDIVGKMDMVEFTKYKNDSEYYKNLYRNMCSGVDTLYKELCEIGVVKREDGEVEDGEVLGGGASASAVAVAVAGQKRSRDIGIGNCLGDTYFKMLKDIAIKMLEYNDDLKDRAVKIEEHEKDLRDWDTEMNKRQEEIDKVSISIADEEKKLEKLKEEHLNYEKNLELYRKDLGSEVGVAVGSAVSDSVSVAVEADKEKDEMKSKIEMLMIENKKLNRTIVEKCKEIYELRMEALE